MGNVKARARRGGRARLRRPTNRSSLLDWIDGREATEPAATLAARGLLRRAQRFRHAYTGRRTHVAGRYSSGGPEGPPLRRSEENFVTVVEIVSFVVTTESP